MSKFASLLNREFILLLTLNSRRHAPESDRPMSYEGPSQETFEQMESSLSGPETVAVFRNAVETARQAIQQSLAGSEKVVEAVNPKLTVDLSHHGIERIPEAVVDILKPGVQM